MDYVVIPAILAATENPRMSWSQRILLAGSCLVGAACGPHVTDPQSDGDGEDGAPLDIGGAQDLGDEPSGFEGWFGTFHAEDQLDVDITGLLASAANLSFSEDGTLVNRYTHCSGGDESDPFTVVYEWELLQPGQVRVSAADGDVPFDFLGTMVSEVTLRTGDDCNQLLMNVVPVEIDPGTVPWFRGEICFEKCEECPSPCGESGNDFPILVRYAYCEGPPPACMN